MNKKKDYSITKWFGANLAELLSDKIKVVYPEFDGPSYILEIKKESVGLTYSNRVELHADKLHKYLPRKYSDAVKILVSILGEENPNETGMFKYYYWVMPIGKFVEKYGLDYYDISIQAIEEITKRNTGEYAIRPYIRKYPKKTIKIMEKWARSDDFHLRRLASEGLRPKLPWSKKLDTFVEKPQHVFKILDLLIDDTSKFVQKSVANNLTDYIKVNKDAALKYIEKYSDNESKNTKWIIKYATRKMY